MKRFMYGTSYLALMLRAPDGEGAGGGAGAPSAGGADAAASGAAGAAAAGAAGAGADAKDAANGGGEPAGDAKPALSGKPADAAAEGDAKPAGEGDAKPKEGEGEPKPALAGKPAAEGEGEGDGSKADDADPVKTLTDKVAELEAKLAETGAPKDGYAEIQMPDGLVMSDEMKTETLDWAKANNFSQAQLEALVEKRSELIKADLKQWNDGVEKWRADARADKEYGGDRYEENKGLMVKALHVFGYDPGLDELMATAGIGDNPDLQRYFYRMGKHLGLGNKTKASEGKVQKQTLAGALYGKSGG